MLNPFEVGDRLLYTGIVNDLEDVDAPMDAPERQVTVDEVDDRGYVYFTYGDGVKDWMHWEHMNQGDYERIPWDSNQ